MRAQKLRVMILGAIFAATFAIYSGAQAPEHEFEDSGVTCSKRIVFNSFEGCWVVGQGCVGGSCGCGPANKFAGVGNDVAG